MSPEVIARKLSKMIQYLRDLSPYRELGFEDFWKDRYKVERIIELLVMTASDITFHLLSMRGEPAPGSYRAAFLRLGEMEIISERLGKNLALGAGLRNILVHDYEEIDHRLLHAGIPQILDDMSDFIEAVSKWA